MYPRYFKRVFDFIFALLCIYLFGWFIILCVIISAIVHGRGIFTQIRIGKNEKPFRIFKIRTMHDSSNNRSETTIKNDSRVSSFGRFLIETKIDELPQIINVLLGDMSLIGPRPTVKSDYELMSSEQKKRFLIRPGITGLAQIEGNTSLKWPERIKYDLIYLNNVSFSLDIKIIIKTISLFLNKEVATHPKTENEWE